MIPASPEIVGFEAQGDGRHLIELDPPPAPGKWLKLTLTVKGRSPAAANIDVWLTHHPGDIDRNGLVDIRDATAFGEEFRGRRSPALTDLNGDGGVNAQDATAFGQIWRGEPPATRAWEGSVLPVRPE